MLLSQQVTLMRLLESLVICCFLGLLVDLSGAFQHVGFYGPLRRRTAARRRVPVAAGRGFGKAKEDSTATNVPSDGSTGEGAGKGGDSIWGRETMPPVQEAPVPATFERKFQMLYTCNLCETRNLIKVDRIAYTKGIVIAKCQGCDAKHLVADNMSKLDFGKGKVTLQDLLAMRGESAQFVNLRDSPDLAAYNLRYKEDGTVELVSKKDDAEAEQSSSE